MEGSGYAEISRIGNLNAPPEKKDNRLSEFCSRKLGRLRSRLIRSAGVSFIAGITVYPFILNTVSLFPESAALSLLQGLVIVTAVPAVVYFLLYKSGFQEEKQKILRWNRMDLERCGELAGFLNFVRSNNREVPPCTEQIISGRKEDGDWKIHRAEYGPFRQNLELVLKGMTLYESRNYAGLGFGTISGIPADQKNDTSVKESHNIEVILVLRNDRKEINVFVPGPVTNVQWLQHMQLALMGSAVACKGSHTYNFLKTASFNELPLRDDRYDTLKKMIKDQAEAAAENKLPVTVRGYPILGDFVIATQLSLGSLSAVSLYQTGFFDIFTEKILSLGMVPRIHVP